MSRSRFRERTSGYKTSSLLESEKKRLIELAKEDEIIKAWEGYRFQVQDAVNRMILLETQGRRVPLSVKLMIDAAAPVMTVHPEKSLEAVQEIGSMRR